ncbi:MAG: hypothetical protein ATN34_01255 [Epulopiscium sp. Nele67-Bin002]|nr:MAG: hypothetical protein ATN34_01255 [Epulopiscium sp. Nele67-Bin002]OON92773.1 MAG: hypothetical protein ATN33_06740 [Epulopiscium sp. Nele67-Bin001]
MDKIGQSVKIKNVGKYYGNFQALENVNLEAERGEFLTILGSSGSGKTTLLKIIAGFEECTTGNIIINNQDVGNLKAYKRNIGMLFQNYALFPHMTVEENIAYPLKLRKIPKTEQRQMVSEIINLVKLNGMEKRYPKQLSGGQQQRVSLARAIVYKPPLLLLDEPLGALDKNLRHEMQFEIKRIQQELGITTISVTHDQEEALTMSDKICIMSHGVVQQCSTPQEIYNNPETRFVAEFMGSTNLIEGIVGNMFKENGKLVTLVNTALSDKPIRVEECEDKRKFHLPNVLVAVRPEAIHLAKQPNSNVNVFKGKIISHVYLGESVSVVVETRDKTMLTIRLTPEAFIDYSVDKELEFYFNPNFAITIYQQEKGVMLNAI